MRKTQKNWKSQSTMETNRNTQQQQILATSEQPERINLHNNDNKENNGVKTRMDKKLDASLFLREGLNRQRDVKKVGSNCINVINTTKHF